MKYYFFAVLYLFLVSNIFAQLGLKNASGESKVYMQNMNIDELEKKAISEARIDALRKAFTVGYANQTEFVSQEINEQSGDKQTSKKMTSDYEKTTERTQGEWVTTTKKFTTELLNDQGGYYMEAKVWGKVREKKRTEIEFIAKSLNCPLSKCLTRSFTQNDTLGFEFKSPVDGYLSIYLDDNESKVFRLFPHGKESISSFEIKGDKEYILFTKKPYLKDISIGDASQFYLKTNKAIEYNTLKILFSKNEISKPYMDLNGKLLSTDRKDFAEWWINLLGDSKQDISFKDIEISISSD